MGRSQISGTGIITPVKVCITEKPSVAKDIARILGADTRKDGYFEGNGYCITWTFGHLCTLKEPHDYSALWKRWSLGQLPMIPPRFGIKLIDDSGIKKQFSVIEALIREADEVINCGDAGQEGELIQRWVMQLAQCDKPVKRLWISSLTDDAIREGFSNLRDHAELQTLYTAGLCRAIGDWILGMNATRLYSLKYGNRGQVLSIGRVQTPTLAIIVARQQEIENFIPKDSWELQTLYKGTVFKATRKPFENEEEGQRWVNRLAPESFHVDDISRKKGREAPPRLFDLTSLQVECNRRFSMSADDTLRTIQSLYEKKLTTYPRVDTTYLPEDVYPKCAAILNSLKEFQEPLQAIRGKRLQKSKKVFDNSKITDHHAIIPTGQPLPSSLSDMERNVFDTVARKFVAVFMPDCTFDQTIVDAHVADVKFKATGKVITDQGWKILYAREPKSDEKRDDGDTETVLPEFTKGESGPHKPQLAKKTSQPPKYFTEGTLLKAMETAGNFVDDEDLREALKANGIGRPSTRAAIIETLYKRGYIRRERKSIRATQAGIDLIGLIREDLIKSAKLTGMWENRLRRIEKGEYDAKEFLDSLKQMMHQVVRTVLSDNTPRKIEAVVADDKPKKRGKNE